MNNQKNISASVVGSIIGILIIIVAIVTYVSYRRHQQALQNTATSTTPGLQSDYVPIGIASTASSSDTASIEDLVTAFGAKLQMVSLAAPKDDLVQSIDDNYSAYVSADLLAQWEANPSTAPGRQTSSPWPDHIEISSIMKNQDGTFTVKGKVIELTSNEVEHGGIADSYPVTMTVQGTSGVWIITALSK